MKALMIALVAMFAVDAHAYPSKNQSWDQIRADRNVTIDNFAPLFGSDGIFNTCVDGDNFRSIKPVKVCVDFVQIPGRNGGDSYEPPTTVCKKWELQHVTLPRTTTGEVCVKWETNEIDGLVCKKKEVRTITTPTTQNLSVWYMYSEATVYLFSKDYTVPACN
jgi:hypothetical protein